MPSYRTGIKCPHCGTTNRCPPPHEPTTRSNLVQCCNCFGLMRVFLEYGEYRVTEGPRVASGRRPRPDDCIVCPHCGYRSRSPIDLAEAGFGRFVNVVVRCFRCQRGVELHFIDSMMVSADPYDGFVRSSPTDPAPERVLRPGRFVKRGR